MPRAVAHLPRCDFWAGSDIVVPSDPKAVKNEDGTVSVSWAAPTRGCHDGYFDPADVTYTVTRQPDNKVAYEGKATSFTDESAKRLPTGTYYYSIKARTGGEYGEAVNTGYFETFAYLVLPYDQEFNDAAAASSMIIDDVNADGYSWEYFPESMTCGVSEEDVDNDDWLLTPAFVFSKDSLYQVTVEASTNADGYKERMEIAAGPAGKGSAMTQMILPLTEVTHSDYKPYSAMFIPEADGECHIGIHCLSRKSEGSYLNINSLKIRCLGTTRHPRCGQRGAGRNRRSRTHGQPLLPCPLDRHDRSCPDRTPEAHRRDPHHRRQGSRFAHRCRPRHPPAH